MRAISNEDSSLLFGLEDLDPEVRRVNLWINPRDGEAELAAAVVIRAVDDIFFRKASKVTLQNAIDFIWDEGKDINSFKNLCHHLKLSPHRLRAGIKERIIRENLDSLIAKGVDLTMTGLV